MKRGKDASSNVKIVDSFGKDCAGSLAGIELRSDGGAISLIASVANWEVQQGKTWVYLVPGNEYEVLHGLMLRKGNKEYFCRIEEASEQPAAKKTPKVENASAKKAAPKKELPACQ